MADQINNYLNLLEIAQFRFSACIDWPDIISVIVDTSPGSSFDVPDHTVPLLGPDDLVDYIAGFSPDRPHETRDVDAVVKLLMGEP